jgi:ornithine cyclodeaminase
MSDSNGASDALLVLGAADVTAALDGREHAVVDAVRDAYLRHREGRTDLPHSVFLRFGDGRPDRIIALPARIEDDAPVAGIKWIASFPGNVRREMARASALLVLNSTETGRPTAVMESSIISAQRTAASAALAARELHPLQQETTLGLIGCGVINFEIARFVASLAPRLDTLVLFDLDTARAQTFAARVTRELPRTSAGLTCRVVERANDVFSGARLVSLATIAATPHLHDLPWTPGHTVLHVSLRDLAARLILEADNVADDVDHVLRANTSLHLAEQQTGRRDFVRCTLADVVAGAAPARVDGRPVVFSPFGLGVLDLAVARLVMAYAQTHRTGVVVPNFLPAFTG